MSPSTDAGIAAITPTAITPATATIERTPEQLARGLFEAFVQRDRAAAELLIARDFRFTSPLDNRLDRNAYFQICWPNGQNIRAMDMQYIATFGERVFVTYEGVRSDGTRFRNTEMLRFKEGQLCEVEVYFGWNVPHPAAPGTHVSPEEATA